ncbi:MAG: hypothetical protein ABL958_10170 [Bdellovibrionia bacterium]
MRPNKRVAPRKQVVGLHVKNLTALDHFSVIARVALLVDISSSGLLLHVDRKHLVPKSLRENLTLQSLEGEHIMLQIKEMDLEIDGKIARTRMIGKGVFEVAVDFSAEAPEYWRECLVDLMPDNAEMEEEF